jgi:hypothetical protein
MLTSLTTGVYMRFLETLKLNRGMRMLILTSDLKLRQSTLRVEYKSQVIHRACLTYKE